jgi:hypothetical protein
MGIKLLASACAFVLLASSDASAQEPRGSLGLGRMHGYNAGASQSGCGSSWAICRYRTQGKSRDTALQGRLRKRCNRATAWMDACR